MIKYFGYSITTVFFLLIIPVICNSWFASLKISFDDAYLVYDVKNNSANIIAEGAIIDYGKNWAIKKIGESTFHIMQTCNDNKMQFFWKIDISRFEIYRVDYGEFGKTGGRELFIHDIEVEIEGDKDDPVKLFLRFPPNSVSICYYAGGASYHIIIYDYSYRILDINEKEHSCIDPTDFEGLYPYDKPAYFKHKKWDNFYWLIDLNKVFLVNGTPGEKFKKLKELNIQIGSCFDDKRELARVVLKNSFIKYETNKQYPQIIVNNAIKATIDNGVGWELKMIEPGIYHLSHTNNLYGAGKFWKIDIPNKAVFRVKGGTFGKSGGKETLLKNININFIGDPKNPDYFVLKFPIGSVYIDVFDLGDNELTVYDFKYESDTCTLSPWENNCCGTWIIEDYADFYQEAFSPKKSSLQKDNEKDGWKYFESYSAFSLRNSAWKVLFWVVDRVENKVYAPAVNLKKTYRKIADLVSVKVLKNLLSGKTDIFYPFVIDVRTDEIIELEFFN